MDRFHGNCAVIGPALALLVACGGGGGGAPISGSSNGPLPATPNPVATSFTVSGKVVQLAGSLAHATVSCTNQSPPPCPTQLPPTSATPSAGAPIVGATVLVTTAGTVASLTPTVIAQGTTDASGSFTITVPASANAGASVGLVAINGQSIVATPRPGYAYGDTTFTLGNLPPFGSNTGTLDPDLGVTDRGYIVAHELVNVTGTTTNAGVIYIDMPSPGESLGIAALDYWRSTVGASNVVLDMAAELAVRRDAANNVPQSGSTCTFNQSTPQNYYAAFRGVGSLVTAATDIDAVSWSMAVFTIGTGENNHPFSTGASSAATLAGVEGVVTSSGCGPHPADPMVTWELVENG